MNDSTRKEVLTAWRKSKQEEITHPYLDENVALGLVLYSSHAVGQADPRGY